MTIQAIIRRVGGNILLYWAAILSPINYVKGLLNV